MFYLMTLDIFYLQLYGVRNMVKVHILFMEGNVLFNDTLDIFYLQLYGVGHMVKVHSDKKREPVVGTTWTILFN